MSKEITIPCMSAAGGDDGDRTLLSWERRGVRVASVQGRQWAITILPLDKVLSALKEIVPVEELDAALKGIGYERSGSKPALTIADGPIEMGDTVEFIASASGSGGIDDRMTVGKHYEVARVDPGWVWVIQDNGEENGWRHKRFRKVVPPTAPVDDDEIRVGDTIENVWDDDSSGIPTGFRAVATDVKLRNGIMKVFFKGPSGNNRHRPIEHYRKVKPAIPGEIKAPTPETPAPELTGMEGDEEFGLFA